MTESGPWWVDAFGGLYATVYAHRDDAAAEREAVFAVKALSAAPGARLLDVGCGSGRHTRALATHGLRVVGVDYSQSLLGGARAAGGPPRYVRADFRALPFRPSFDHVTSFFTSFGYFDDAGNAAQLREMRRVLRAGGTLLLDFLNAPRVAETLVATSEKTVTPTRRIRERRAIRSMRVEKHVEVHEGDEVVARWTESVRLYERGDVEVMLRAASLEPSAVHGDLAGGAFSPASDRLVVVARAA